MRLQGVGRRYGLTGPWVLRGVDLDLPPRSLLRVEGANGSGKSTLLRVVAGIDAPSAGRVTGRPRTAYVPERFPAELPFTALGYLTHLGRVHGLGRTAAARGAGEWLERFGAAGHAGTPLAELSKGTSQKVAVAQALLAAPGLLVLDEAWTGLDQAARAVLDRAVAERVAAGGTVVFVDHDPRRLAGAEDAVYRVADGGVREVPRRSTPTGTAARPRVVIDAEAPDGAELPRDLPGAPVWEPVPDDPGPASRAADPGAVRPGAAAAVGTAGADGEPGGHGGPGTGRPAAQGAAAAAPYEPDAHQRPGAASATGVRRVRLTVAAAHSDALLRTLLTAWPPWHIRDVTAAPAAPERSSAVVSVTEASSVVPTVSERSLVAPVASEPSPAVASVADVSPVMPTVSERSSAAPAAPERSSAVVSVTEASSVVPTVSERSLAAPAASEPSSAVPPVPEPSSAVPPVPEPSSAVPPVPEPSPAVRPVPEPSRAVPPAGPGTRR
ncbi:ATP-binding cassette domain-containing protein [Streptomyces sp. P1-3]|uniref:ABC transporter ATP-binding protein n=1 Tax=Streptomyces sp. P1-3 TaxID=3421658 RepID=UPI003D35AFA4